MKMLVEEFKTHIMEDGKSPETIQSYIWGIAGLLKYLQKMAIELDGSLKGLYVTSTGIDDI